MRSSRSRSYSVSTCGRAAAGGSHGGREQSVQRQNEERGGQAVSWERFVLLGNVSVEELRRIRGETSVLPHVAARRQWGLFWESEGKRNTQTQLANASN